MADDLIATMRFDPDDGLLGVEETLAELKAQAAAMGFAFDRHGARNDLQAATFRLRTSTDVRLAIARSGAVAIEVAAPR